MTTYQLDELFFTADRLIHEGHVAKALEILDSITRQKPDYGKAYNHLAWIYEHKYYHYAKAETLYRTALAYSPEYAPIYSNYANLLLTMRKFSDLEALLEKARHVPGTCFATIYYLYGIMYELQQQYALAIEYFQKAIADSLSDDDLDLYESSIKRCEKKAKLFNSVARFS
jgi:Tfp pilus assembly protein PilF